VTDRPPDLIFVSMENWDDVWRRNQFVCAELARRYPQMKILFVGLPKNVSHALRHGQLSELRRATTYRAPDFDSITITHPPKLFPDSIVLGRRLNELTFRRHVSRVARDLGIRSPILWLNPHSAVHMVGRMGEAAVIYDVTDDWASLTQSPRLTERIRRQDAELCQRADDVIVCSKRLAEMKEPFARRLRLIPNGVDNGHYAQVLDVAAPLLPMARQWPKPVFGYTGTIHPDRIDVDLVEAVARRLTAGSIVLVGPNHLSARDRERLDACGNVFMPGPVPYAQIPDVMRAFDVCITPHRQTPFTESLNPIKLWEYLAAGKPIVSTPVAGFRDYPQLVELATGSDDFVAAMHRALREDLTKVDGRRAEAARNSWSSRVDAIVDVFKSLGEPASSTTLSAVIVSYNTRQMTLECLRRLMPELQGLDHEVWLVDNASTDGTADDVGQHFPHVKLIRNAVNRGFGAANNQAIREAAGEYVLLLNTDAFVKPGAVRALLDFATSRPDTAVVGPKLLNRDGSLQLSCYRFPSPRRAACEHLLLTAAFPNHAGVGDYRAWPHDRARDVDFVTGACMLVRRSAIRQVGLFDESFFFYGEETDWCRRFRSAGWKVAFTPAAQVVHYGGASGKSDSAKTFHEFHAARERFIQKHHGRLGLFTFRTFEVVGSIARISLFGLASLIPGRARERHRELVAKWVRILTWTLGNRRIPLASKPAPSAAPPLAQPNSTT
jgi:GT2 family glycosyltransferase/glycosyltransferase involved in cell wall biosynthesis